RSNSPAGVPGPTRVRNSFSACLMTVHRSKEIEVERSTGGAYFPESPSRACVRSCFFPVTSVFDIPFVFFEGRKIRNGCLAKIGGQKAATPDAIMHPTWRRHKDRMSRNAPCTLQGLHSNSPMRKFVFLFNSLALAGAALMRGNCAETAQRAVNISFKARRASSFLVTVYSQS